MAVSPDSYPSREGDPKWHLVTGEEVSLKMNCDIFHPDGSLKGHTQFSADRDNQLFTLRWPKLAAKCVSTLSRWQLVMTTATPDHIASFNRSTAQSLGENQWDVVKKVVADCRGKFQARLLSMSCQEIVFAHEDRLSAERMKDSNEMVDIMNTLLADLETQYSDIMVDWEVKVTPVNVSLSYRPAEVGEEERNQFGSLILMDADSPSSPSKGEVTKQPSVYALEDAPPYFQHLVDFVASESKKTHDALLKMATENTYRHRILCQKVEELRSHIRQLSRGEVCIEETHENQSEIETHIAQQAGSTEGSIPSIELFGTHGSPQLPEDPSRDGALRNDLSPRQLNQEGHQPSQKQAAGKRNSRSKEKRQLDQQAARNVERTTEVLKKDCVKPSETFRELTGTLSTSEQENRNLDEAVDRAYRHDDVPPPKAKSYYTMLCLDVSESMIKHGAFEQMKQVVDTFIDGVEDIVSTMGVEENIGVVTFGGTSNVVQNLTNDFARVRDAIDNIKLGGRSPFIQALMVSMAAFVDKAGVISVSGVYDVRPRIVFISDGHPTENMDDGGVDYAYDKLHVRTSLTKLMVDFANKEKYEKIKPVVYIPVGREADKELMKSMATLSNGVYVEPEEVEKLCGYFLIQEVIGKTLAVLDRDEQRSEDHIRNLIMGLMPDLNEEQKDQVLKAVIQEQESPTKKRIRHRKSDMEDMYENTEKVNAGEMLPLGTRVTRGPDWCWENQDGGGPGTVISHTDKGGWTYVAWDFTDRHNRYGFGPEHGYHIWKTDDHPRLMGEDQEMKIGMMVQKGPDWRYHHEESLRNAVHGVVIRKSRSQRRLMVRWNNGERQVVRWGADDNKYDVMYCDPREIPQETALEFKTDGAMPAHSQFSPPGGGQPAVAAKEPSRAEAPPSFEKGKWQWRDEHMNWNDYPPEDSARIESIFKKTPNGSCIVKRDRQNRRIMFRRFTEKTVDGGAECPVQRVQV